MCASEISTTLSNWDNLCRYKSTSGVKKPPVEDEVFRRIANHLRWIYRIYLDFIKENQKITTYNWLDLETLGSWPIVPKDLLGHWCELFYSIIFLNLFDFKNNIKDPKLPYMIHLN